VDTRDELRKKGEGKESGSEHLETREIVVDPHPKSTGSSEEGRGAVR